MTASTFYEWLLTILTHAISFVSGVIAVFLVIWVLLWWNPDCRKCGKSRTVCNCNPISANNSNQG
jgi:hypothetical protein